LQPGFVRRYREPISPRNSGKKSPQTFRAELFLHGISRFQDAIRSEKNDVSRTPSRWTTIDWSRETSFFSLRMAILESENTVQEEFGPERLGALLSLFLGEIRLAISPNESWLQRTATAARHCAARRSHLGRAAGDRRHIFRLFETPIIY